MFLSSHDLSLLIVISLFSLLISLSVSYVVARGIASSVEQLTEGALALAEGDLSVRLNGSTKDEVAGLARALNTMAQELERSFRRQAELEQARNDLVASVSHDLRTPLASMRVMVEAIGDGVVTDQPTVRRYCKSLEGEVERLSQLIDDLFELSRLDSGSRSLRLVPNSVDEILSMTLDSMKAQAEGQELDLRARLETEAGSVMADTHMIQRALCNLIQNAIRHTPPDGTILVEAHDQGQMVRIDVIDTGQGIPAPEIEKVFDRFYRGEKSRSREFAGRRPRACHCKGNRRGARRQDLGGERHRGWEPVQFLPAEVRPARRNGVEKPLSHRPSGSGRKISRINIIVRFVPRM